jgi:tetratricopeptide (TPR) repeat protein
LKFSTGTIKQDWAWRWNGSYYQTIGDLYFYKGKYDEADIAYQYAIASLDSGVSSYDKNYNHQGVAGSSFEQGNSPDYIKGLIEELLREKSEVLIHLRKINEAENYSREALKRSLARTGQASTSSSSSMRQLAIVMLARDRNKDAVFLLNQALLGLKDAGVSEDATQFSKTKKTLASALIFGNQFSQALKIYSNLDTTIKTYPDVGRFVDINSLDRILALIRIGDLSQAESRARNFLGTTEKRTGQKSKETADAKLMLATALASQTKDDEARQLFSAGMVELIALEREVATDSEGLSSKEKKYLAAYIESYLGVVSLLLLLLKFFHGYRYTSLHMID